MSRKLSIRERWLLVVAPTVLVLAVHVFGVYRPRQGALADAERRLGQSRRDLVSPSLVVTRRSELAQLQERIKAEKASMDEPKVASSRPDAVSASLAAVRSEARAMAKISRVFADRNIVVIAATRLAEGDGGNFTPADVRESIRQLGGSVADGACVWRLELVGDFRSVQESLDALESIDSLLVPVGVSMDPLPGDGAQHHWRLWLWM